MVMTTYHILSHAVSLGGKRDSNLDEIATKQNGFGAQHCTIIDAHPIWPHKGVSLSCVSNNWALEGSGNH